MKKLLFLLSIILTGCNCTLVLSQIPPQFISPTVGCSVALPDYTKLVPVSDNCGIKSYTQNPLPGTIISATTNVTLEAIDLANNFRKIVFTVTPKDTVKPVFHIDPLLTYSWDTITKVYNLGDRTIALMMANVGIVDSPDYFKSDSGLYFKDVNGNKIIPFPKPYRDYYMDKVLIVYTSPGHAFEGWGMRRFDFIEPLY